jgi:hypothetical protein
MSPPWYSRATSDSLYELPPATPFQIKRAQEMLRTTGAILLDDYDGHVGAFTLLGDHLRKVASSPPERDELKSRIRAIASRPSFDVRDPIPSRFRQSYWAWIDPRSIAHGRGLGKSFPRNSYSASGMADQAREIIDNREDTALYVHYFDDPRYGYGIVVSSFPGPLGAIRQITTNGNHRSMAFEALRSPLVLAEILDERPPYRITYDEDDDWETTRDFLNWQAEKGILRMSTRPVVRDSRRVELRIAEAETPWLAASPREALAALKAHEKFWALRLNNIGSLSVAELRRVWSGTASKEVRKPSALTLIEPPTSNIFVR